MYQATGTPDWPLTASSSTELTAKLDAAGFLTPLPSESAALANVIEVALVDYLIGRLAELQESGADALGEKGATRGYPDLEVSGEAFGGGPRAVDIKMARIKVYYWAIRL